MKKIVAAIGKWVPIHNGHKNFLLNLVKDETVDKLIIMIGSCYERSEVRYAITANEREKMIRAIMKREGISESKYKIVPVSDYPTFDEWIIKVLEVCKENSVTHFCTGNREDILDVLAKNNIELGMELINPEIGSPFPYHATDIRNMIINGDYDRVVKLIPDEIQPILFNYSVKEILAASDNRAINFLHGRQTVDMILLIKDIFDGNTYVLAGNRPDDAVDFGGYLAFPGDAIHEFETVSEAAIRTLYEETGIKITMLDNSLEPAIVKFNDIKNPTFEQMYVNGIYGSNDISKNGTKGGSSQCFTIYVEGDINDYINLINPIKGLTNVKFYDLNTIRQEHLAFEQNDMLEKAINMFFAYPKLHLSRKKII